MKGDIMKKFLALFTFSFFFIISPFITPNAVNINAKEIKILEIQCPFISRMQPIILENYME